MKHVGGNWGRFLSFRPNKVTKIVSEKSWLGNRDSNPNRQSQSLLSYH